MGDGHHEHVLGRVGPTILLDSTSNKESLALTSVKDYSTIYKIDLRGHSNPQKFLDKVRKCIGKDVEIQLEGDFLVVEMVNMSAKYRMETLLRIDRFAKSEIFPVITRGQWKEQ